MTDEIREQIALIKRLRQHAMAHDLTESAPDEPGELTRDLRDAADIIHGMVNLTALLAKRKIEHSEREIVSAARIEEMTRALDQEKRWHDTTLKNLDAATKWASEEKTRADAAERQLAEANARLMERGK